MVFCHLCALDFGRAKLMELFNDDRVAHPWHPHVFAVPRLMTHLWRKQLSKDADLMFTVTVGDNHFWTKFCHTVRITGAPGWLEELRRAQERSRSSSRASSSAPSGTQGNLLS